jgi:transposase
MILAHKIRLYPTKKQEQDLVRACGCSRFAYNWGLAEWDRMYKAGEKVNRFILCKKFNSIKKEQFPWIYESPKDANQYPFINLGKAFTSFFKKKSKYPKFKRKGVHDSFYVSSDKAILLDRIIKIYNLGTIKLAEELRFSGKIMSYTISRTADIWFVSIAVEMKDYSKQRISNNCIGIDIGIKNTVGMLKNHKLARSISDASFSEIRRQLEYKTKIYNNNIIIADRFYPSSKLCSNCGSIKKELKLSDRTYCCSECGFSIDRDVNAAKNLRTPGYRRSNACGQEGSGFRGNSETKLCLDETRINTYSLVSSY